MSMKLNDLFDYNYKIYQDDQYFKFSIDSVLLAEFIKVRKNKYKLLDICTGNLPVPLILDDIYNKKLDITAFEIQEEIYKIGLESLKYNKVTNINYINDDIKNYKNYNLKKFDIITCNPPYFSVYDENNVNYNIVKSIARHEIKINLEDIISISSKLINNSGYLYMVHRTERLSDVICLLNKYNFGIKRIQFVYDNDKSDCKIFLVEACFNGKNYISISKPVYLKDKVSYKGIFEGGIM